VDVRTKLGVPLKRKQMVPAPRVPALLTSSLRALGRDRLASLLAATAAFRADGVEARSVPGMGVGLFASEPLSAGREVLSVPRALWQPYSAVEALAQARQRAPPFAQSLEAAAAELAAAGVAGAARLPEHVSLALSLLFAKAAGDAFAESLEPPDTPLLWPEAALAQLAGTRTCDAVRTRRAFVAALHSRLFGDGGLPLPAFAAGLALVLSRALSGASAPCATLVPALDLLNHADAASCAHAYDASSGAFSVTALRPHAAGEQLFIRYAQPLDNDASLRLYGFARRGGVTAALLPPPWPVPGGPERLLARKRAALARTAAQPPPAGGGCFWWGAEEDAAAVPVSGAAEAQAVLAVLRVMNAGEAEMGPEGAAVDARAPLGPVSEVAARAQLRAAAAEAARRYPAGLEETRAALEGGGLAPRATAALTVREGELAALRAVEEAAGAGE